MSKNPDEIIKIYPHTQNRELSWLQFNRRVLEEAGDWSVPLLERLKFISIFTSNLDEFFMVRVGSLFDLAMISPREKDNKTGMTPKEQLEKIYAVIPGLLQIKERLYGSVSRQLAEAGISEITLEELNDGISAEEGKYIAHHFKTLVKPILSPQIVDSHHPFPHLLNKNLYIAAQLFDKKGRESLGLIPVPTSVSLFLILPEGLAKETGRRITRYVRLENVILTEASSLFGSYQVVESCVLSVTRNADLSFDEEKFEDDDCDDFRNRMSKLLKKRSRMAPVRLELSRCVCGEFRALLKSRIPLEDHQIYVDRAPLNMKYVFSLIGSLPPGRTEGMLFPTYEPRWPEDLDPKKSVMEQVRERDRFLFFPFDSVDPFLRLLDEAASDPKVASIKITIYRLASSSRIVRRLCRAAENGKEVTVLMELRARFDEENNITWSRILEDAGCRVVYGIEHYKCHSKICLITRQGEKGLEYITQIGTGNYNEKTNAMYTDLSLMTASENMGLDATAFFQNMLVGDLEGTYQELLVAPTGIKSHLIQLIDEQIQKGPEGYICIKANSMTERQMIDKLAEASQVGVEIQLILRGICCLRPGVNGLTEHIHVTSIVGRYLEHARIYCFGRGDNVKLYISSADLMTRNLNRRVEVACPVREKQVIRALLEILDVQLSDNVKATALLPHGSYYRKVDDGPTVNSQQYFMEHSLHHKQASEEETIQAGSLFQTLLNKLRKTLQF